MFCRFHDLTKDIINNKPQKYLMYTRLRAAKAAQVAASDRQALKDRQTTKVQQRAVNTAAINAGGQNALTLGSLNNASGSNSIALGLSNTAGASNSVVLGSYGLTNALLANGSFVYSATAGSSVFAAKGPRGFFARVPGFYNLSADGANKFTTPASGLTAGFYFQLDDVVPNSAATRHYVAGISYTRPQERTGQPTAVGSISYHAQAPSRWTSKFGQEPGNVAHALDLLASMQTSSQDVTTAGSGVSLLSSDNSTIKSLVAGPGITVTSSDSEITISAAETTLPSETPVSSETTVPVEISLTSETTDGRDGVASLIVSGSGANFVIKNIAVGDGLMLTQTESEIVLSTATVDSVATQAELTTTGTGESLVADASLMSLKSIVAGTGVSLVADDTSITLAVDVPPAKTLVAGTGVSLVSDDTTVTISSTQQQQQQQPQLALTFSISPGGQQISENNWTLVGSYLPFSAARAVSGGSPMIHIVASLKVVTSLDIRVLASDIVPSSPLLAQTALTTAAMTTYKFPLIRVPAIDCLIEINARVGQGQPGSAGTKYGTIFAAIVYL